MNKAQLISLLDACPDDFDIYIEGADMDYDIVTARVEYSEGVLVLQVDNEISNVADDATDSVCDEEDADEDAWDYGDVSQVPDDVRFLREV